MSPIRNVLICCAGTDTRLGLNMPKCLVPIEGRPLLHWQLDQLEEIENVVIVIGYRASEVMGAVLAKRPDAIFVINHEFETTSTLDSMVRGAAYFREPFIYLDGDLLITPDAIQAVSDASCPCIGIRRTYSDQPVCVRMGDGSNPNMVTAFTRELEDYEWTGLAQLSPQHVKMGADEAYVYQAIEHFLPVASVKIDCVEIDTQEDLDEAKSWMKKRLASGAFGRLAEAV
jgi:choline kinase